MPLWDWKLIPGTTTPQEPDIPLMYDNLINGISSMVGGVSDSIYGVTMYDYQDTLVHTSARKGYFFFDKEVVCLGNSLISNYKLRTTIDQCWGGDSVVVYDAKGNIYKLSGEIPSTNYNNLRAVQHKGIGYVFPTNCNLNIENTYRFGNWTDINQAGWVPDSVVNGKVFTLYMNHDNEPIPNMKKDYYEYILYPNTNTNNLVSCIASNDLEILANNDSIQAVWHKGIDVCELIFYRPCSFTNKDISVQVSHACCLIVRGLLRGNVMVSFADPTQSGECYYITIGKGDEIKDLLFDMSSMEYEYAGKSVSQELSFNATSILDSYSDLQTNKIILSNKPVSGVPFSFSITGLSPYDEGEFYLCSANGITLEKKKYSQNMEIIVPYKGVYILSIRSNSGVCANKKIVVN